ncbi:hypothetical protein M1439_02225 [Candidatus Marsarchaeota archaeon]|jgi:hypothetical protein|nr:hypothetical protein [Candidatus Marsarchaeota archaeon]MCL5092331.1 hypothetical protein [Candidatus Marsarchaeota archaeon]
MFIKTATLLPLYANLGSAVLDISKPTDSEQTLELLRGNEELVDIPIASGIKMLDVVNKFFTSDIKIQDAFFNVRIIDGNISLGYFKAAYPEDMRKCAANMLPDFHYDLVERSIRYLRQNADVVGLLRDFKTDYNLDRFTVTLFGNPVLKKHT